MTEEKSFLAEPEKISIFKNLSRGEIDELLKIASIEKYPAGAGVFSEGAPGSSLFVVASGKVKIFRNLSDGSVVDITNFSENEFFGEMSFMDNQARSANAVALNDTVLINLSAAAFESYSKKMPEAAFRFHKNILSEIQERLRRTNERYSYHVIWGKTMKDALSKNYEELLKAHLELSASRNFLYNVLNNSSEVIIVLDPSENVVIFNSGAEEALKFKSTEILGRKIGGLFYFEQYPEVIRMLLADGQVRNFEACMKSADGNRLILSLSAFIINGSAEVEAGFGEGIVLIGRNVTEKKLLERQILQNEKMIFLGKTISEIIHDVRNPLTIIQLASECLAFKLGELGDESLHKNIVQIEESVKRIQKVISGTLDFAKVVPTSKEEIDVVPVIEKAIGICSMNRAAKKVELKFERPKMPMKIVGSYSQLEQVFVNLIMNSIQAIPDGVDGKVIAAVCQDKNDVNIVFSDNGIGISDDILPNIFEPFFTTKLAGEGTGLGLAICQAIVAQHGGVITCESKLNAGTNFIVRLPAAPPEEPSAPSDDDISLE